MIVAFVLIMTESYAYDSYDTFPTCLAGALQDGVTTQHKMAYFGTIQASCCSSLVFNADVCSLFVDLLKNILKCESKAA